jgi:transglutaminase-like putative cysteine protease
VELTPGPSLTNGRRIVRALAVLVFACGLSLSAARVVGTRVEPILFIPAVLAVLVGWLMSRMHIVARVLGQLTGFVVSGLLVAYAAEGTAASFGRGLLDGPRQVITTAWPSPRFPTIFVALGSLIYLVTAMSIDLAMRVRWRAMAIVPMVVGMVALIAVGAPDGAQWQALALGAVASFVLLWIGLDDRVASMRSGMIVAASAGLAALLVTLGVGVAVADRANPRTRDPADSQLALLDPLANVASQTAVDPPLDLYGVESSSLPALHQWRLSALDVYNGEAWATSGRLLPVGNRLDEPTGADVTNVRVTVDRSDIDLWVSPGLILRSSSPVEADGRRRVIRIIGEDRPAVTVFTVEPLKEFDPATAGDVSTLQPTDIESSFTSLATTLAETGTVAQKVANLAAALRDGEYIYNPETQGGVQQNLVDRFLRNTKVGNAEQFVTAFVLLARSLGVDARIATGYNLEATTVTATIQTDDAAAWAEVRVADGWAIVNVVPEVSESTEPEDIPAGQPETPPAAQPIDQGQVDQTDQNEPVDAALPPEETPGWSGVRVWVLRGGLFTGLLLWPVLLFAVIVTWKKLRRRRGLKAADPARRVSTAWTLATDALVDAGATLQNSDTNAELVEAGVKMQPAAGPPLGRLQRHADAVTFATTSCDPKRAEDAVDQLKLVESSIRNSSSRWWRWKWWLSTRSLRRKTQSPLR